MQPLGVFAPNVLLGHVDEGRGVVIGNCFTLGYFEHEGVINLGCVGA